MAQGAHLRHIAPSDFRDDILCNVQPTHNGNVFGWVVPGPRPGPPDLSLPATVFSAWLPSASSLNLLILHNGSVTLQPSDLGRLPQHMHVMQLSRLAASRVRGGSHSSRPFVYLPTHTRPIDLDLHSFSRLIFTGI